MSGDISLPLEGCRFNLRVAGILLREGRVLAMRSEGIPYYYPPGGRIRQNEDSAAALRRELYEELGASPPVGRLLWVAESFFWEETSCEKYHEVCFYYLLGDDAAIPKAPAFTRAEQNRAQEFLWHPVSDIATLDFRPAFLKERLARPPAQAVHILDYQ